MNNSLPTVFLGGTVAGSEWRNQLIPLLQINYFNPVVEDWNEEAMHLELEHRHKDEYLLYVLTPKMEGFYSVAELVDDAHKNPQRTIFTFLEQDGDAVFTAHQMKSLRQVAKLVSKLGVYSFDTLDEVANFLNHDWKKALV
ncbi:MAG TPA: hypothetical protein DCE41_20605 [Cytophagales bacterium]|nr:hypothetical protein [Cytophagales bacterium]HAA21976.1 hypothetical protein [Cytophagales bacterium]HAP61328.1 hypothetical protein [Cytophagales bacterium]